MFVHFQEDYANQLKNIADHFNQTQQSKLEEQKSENEEKEKEAKNKKKERFHIVQSSEPIM